MKYLKIGFLTFILFFTCIFGIKTYAAVGDVTVKVKTVIDNINEVPTSVRTKKFKYGASRVVSFVRPYGVENNCLVPAEGDTRTNTFEWTHGQTSPVFFYAMNHTTYYNILTFQTVASTEANISLERIEYGDNTGAYTYNDDGKASVPITPMNWAVLKNSWKKTAEITLHFRYNPDIGEAGKAPEPTVNYSKTIDYLGDGGGNSDTSVSGKNDYRLYLNVKEEEGAKEKAKDIIFLLDVSNSMNEHLGSSTRFARMKSVVAGSMATLTKDPNNRISIIQFGTNTRTLVTQSSNRAQLEKTANGMTLPGGAEGGTNYYQGFKSAQGIVSGLLDPNRETIVFFLTDGLPTAALPATNARGYNVQYPIALPYAMEAAKGFPKVTSFYSVFIGDNPGDASTLQTVTQAVKVNKEKYMVHVSSPEQLTNAFDRFLSKVGGHLYDVTIEDTLSDYVDYTGGSKVVAVEGGRRKTLVMNTDYNLSYDAASKKVRMKLLKPTNPGSEYILSFNVRSSNKALLEYNTNQTYPSVGDSGTDYGSNNTSSGKPGFFSNNDARLNFKFDGGKPAEKIYSKPVVQVVPPPVLPVVIEAKKELTGKVLQNEQFEFMLFEKLADGSKREIGRAKNDADGKIVFTSLNITNPGDFTYYMQEVIPDTREPGMVYDETVFELKVKIAWENDVLIVKNIKYDKQPLFVNKYVPTPVIINLKAKKQLTGRALRANEFEFSLTKNGAVLETVRNAQNGDITFAPITLADAGTYEYYIREVPPIPADEHIIYDVVPRKVTVVVTDTGGALAADVQYAPDNIFKNEFRFKPAQPVIQLKVVLTGMRLVGGAFEFELKDNNVDLGTTKKVRNTADGYINFEDITFPNPGTYNFEVKQILPKPRGEYMTYDEKVITVTVDVADDGTGDLQANISFSETPEFDNHYQVRGGIW